LKKKQKPGMKLVTGGWQWVDSTWFQIGQSPRYGDWSWWRPGYPTNNYVHF